MIAIRLDNRFSLDFIYCFKLLTKSFFLFFRYISISTRSTKEELLFFSDPAHLERAIHKEKRGSQDFWDHANLFEFRATFGIVSTQHVSSQTQPSIDRHHFWDRANLFELRATQTSLHDTHILPSHAVLKRTRSMDNITPESIDNNTPESIDNNRETPNDNSSRAAIDARL